MDHVQENYDFKLNKKVKELARKSALTYKALEEAILVVEDFAFESPKTREMVQISNNLKINDKKSLFVLPEENKNIYLSSRNLQAVFCHNCFRIKHLSDIKR